ncbi:NAD-dependent epimerase/dehydratase family protein [Methyloterricola oryzae]|uniref:NAD-dependent epimerase/dehydratase family protein n=1 Tax=Methyloterricola oryzae TaxID=1495050 RepID=UPI00069C1AD3|nr:NAD-dependent epimerase/dehydratase family protein [Methyloterricola oryzae]
MDILVTGGTSFTARYLLPELIENFPSAQITVTDKCPGAQLPYNISYVNADLRERVDIDRLLAGNGPEIIFHLAGYGGRDANRCFEVNLGATRNLMEAAASLDVKPRILHVSSASVYGVTEHRESPVKEIAPLRPVASYGASKAAAELAAFTYFYQYRLPVTVVRPFNLIGPGLPLGLAPADFLARLRNIQANQRGGVLSVGNLDSERDFVDVRDAVRAYVALVECDDVWGHPFNVASGVAVSIRTIVESFIDLIGLHVSIHQDPTFKQQVEVASQVGDFTKLRELTGWAPRFSLQDSLRDMVCE